MIRVVLADDSSAFRTLARYTLTTKRGFDMVGEASDGAQALALVATQQPDCVVLDIEMPGMGGFEALAELRGRAPEIPVIMLSGHSDATVTDQVRESGAVALLDKTSQLGLLADTIRSQVASPTETAQPTQTVSIPGSAESLEVDQPVEATLAELRRLEYVVSHDLGEPLRILAGFASLLESRYGESLDETGQSFVTQISAASRRMQGMLADLLTYSRAGRLQPRHLDVQLDHLVATLRTELSDRLAERGAEMNVGALPCVVGDPEMVLLVLRHLVVNAITFNTAPVPTVHIAGRRDGDVAVVTVTDNGIGIEPAHRDRVFDLFQRLNTREEYPGTGTGLALCRRVVTMQHGTLDVATGPEAGSTFTLILPAGPEDSRSATSTHRSSA